MYIFELLLLVDLFSPKWSKYPNNAPRIGRWHGDCYAVFTGIALMWLRLSGSHALSLYFCVEKYDAWPFTPWFERIIWVF